MLHVQLGKKQYLRHSVIWQAYRSGKRFPLEVFAINTKLLTAYYLHQYKTKQKKIEEILHNLKTQHQYQKEDYNILRLYAFFNHKSQRTFQIKMPFKNRQEQIRIQTLSKIGTNKSQNEIFQDPLGLNLCNNDKFLLDYVCCFEKQLRNQSEDQIDKMLISFTPWTILKLVKLCRVPQFYWLEQSTKHSILKFVNQFILAGWYNISTLSIILGRINKARIATPLLQCLDDLVNFKQKETNPNLRIRINFSRENLQKKDILSEFQYNSFKKQLIIMLQYLSIKYQLLYTPQNEKKAILEQILSILQKKVNMRKDFGILELIALHSTITKLHKVVQQQKVQGTSFYSINLDDSEDLLPIVQELELLISEKSNHLKNKKLQDMAQFYTYCRQQSINYPSSIKQIKKIIKAEVDSPVLFAKDIQDIDKIIKLSDYFDEGQWLKHVLQKRNGDINKLQLLSFPTYYQQRSSIFWQQIQKEKSQFKPNELPNDLIFYLENQQLFKDCYKKSKNTEQKPFLGINSLYDFYRISTYKQSEKLQQLINSATLLTEQQQKKLKYLLKASKQGHKLTKTQIRKLYVWRQLTMPA